MVLHGRRCSLPIQEDGAGPVGRGDSEAYEGYSQPPSLTLSGLLVGYWKIDIVDCH